MAISRRVIISLLCLSIVGLFVFFHDNTDRRVHSLRTDAAEILMFSASNSKLYKQMLEEDAKRNAQLDELIMANVQPNSKSCLSDPTSTTKSTKKQLESFVEGNCAPVIIVPGLMGTKLMVQINCELLKAKNPEIMEACGWTTCNRLDPTGVRPDDEYLMWIPKLSSPMGIVTIKNNTCFGRLMSLRYDNTKPVHQKYADAEGVTITWYGNTPKTYADAEGGFNAVSDLLPLPVQTGDTKEFAGLARYLTTLGYQKGLSMFAIPYDFRLAHLANAVSYTLERTIRYAYSLTGKKVIIIAHSLGNLNTLPVLLKMSQGNKDRMIANYIAVTPPFGGAGGTIRAYLGGDERFMIFKDIIGFKFANQKGFLGSFASGGDLLPKDTFTRFRSDPWMKDLLTRMQYEKTVSPYTPEGKAFWKSGKYPFSFFPPPTEMCFAGFTERPQECQTLITDLQSMPAAIVDGNQYFPTHDSMRELFRKHFTMRKPEEMIAMYNDNLASGVHGFGNPGVPVTYVYGTHLPSEIQNRWDYKPEVNTRAGEFAFPTAITKKHGDATVEVSYALPIAMKWAWEHKNGVGLSKPVKVVEYCSRYNAKGSFWDGKDKKGQNIMTKTDYIGLPCDCLTTLPGPGSACTHTNIVGDSYFIRMIDDLTYTKEYARLKDTAAYKLSDATLNQLKVQLPHIRNPREDQNVKQWLGLPPLSSPRANRTKRSKHAKRSKHGDDFDEIEDMYDIEE